MAKKLKLKSPKKMKESIEQMKPQKKKIIFAKLTMKRVLILLCNGGKNKNVIKNVNYKIAV